MDLPELDELRRMVSMMGTLYDTPHLSLWRRVGDEVTYLYALCADWRDLRDAPEFWKAQRHDLRRGHSIGLDKTLLCPLFAVDRSLAGMLMVRDPIILDEDYADRFSLAELATMVLDRLGPAMMEYVSAAAEAAEDEARRGAEPADEEAGQSQGVAAEERQTHYSTLTRPTQRLVRPRPRRPRTH